MKILFVSPEYPHPGPSGGIASYVRDISQELSCRGHDVKILSVEDHLSIGARYTILQDGGVEVHFISRSYSVWLSKLLGHPFFRHGFPWPIPDLEALLSPANVYLYYKRRIRKWKPDIIESYDWQAHGFFIHLLERRVPTVFRGEGHAKVIVENNGKVWTKRHESQHRLERWAARTSSFVVPCSKLLGHDEMRHFGIPAEKIQPIPNCFSPDMLTGKRLERNEENREIRVCFVGRIEHRKGVDLLLEAGHRLHARFPEVRYFFIGEDHLGVRDYLEKKNFSDEYLAKLHFIGQLSRHEIQQYLLKSDFAVFPSRYEPFGIVALESMACGLPVIVSSAGGWSEAVEDGVTGFLVEPGNVESLRQAMEKIILFGPEKRRQIGDQARRIMQERFSAAEIAGQMEAFYRDAVKERSQTRGIH